jgi:hypothetical protein
MGGSLVKATRVSARTARSVAERLRSNSTYGGSPAPSQPRLDRHSPRASGDTGEGSEQTGSSHLRFVSHRGVRAAFNAEALTIPRPVPWQPPRTIAAACPSQPIHEACHSSGERHGLHTRRGVQCDGRRCRPIAHSMSERGILEDEKDCPYPVKLLRMSIASSIQSSMLLLM